MRRATSLALLPCLLLACSDDGESKPLEQITFDALVNACIVSSACGVKRYPKVGECVDYYYTTHLPLGLGPVYDRIFGCLAQAKGDCAAAFDCYGSHKAAGRCDTTYVAKCEGSKALSCDTLAGPDGDGRVFTFDCADAALTCSTRKSGSLFEADCTPGPCSAPGTNRKCEGDRRISCKADGNIEVIDCAVQGLVCEKSPLTGALDCTGEASDECDIPPDAHQNRCEGSVAVTCVNNKIHRQDCAKRPYNTRCVAGECKPAGSACDADDFNRCQGDKLEYCLDGTWRSVDCAAIGLRPCKPTTFGADCSS